MYAHDPATYFVAAVIEDSAKVVQQQVQQYLSAVSKFNVAKSIKFIFCISCGQEINFKLSYAVAERVDSNHGSKAAAEAVAASSNDEISEWVVLFS